MIKKTDHRIHTYLFNVRKKKQLNYINLRVVKFVYL